MAVFLQVLLLLSGLFLMLIILLQRGRGGGLAGAFGGLGGQSAFGTKAGDVFTWITVGTATAWVLLAGIGGCVMRQSVDTYAKQTFASGELTTGEDGETAGVGTDGEQATDTSDAESDKQAPEETAKPAEMEEKKSESASPATDKPAPAKSDDKPSTDKESTKPSESAKPAETEEKKSESVPPATDKPAPAKSDDKPSTDKEPTKQTGGDAAEASGESSGNSEKK